MEMGIERQGVLVGLLDWLYEEFKDDLPSFVRLPVHLALAIAHKASPVQKEMLKAATTEDIERAILASRLAAQYSEASTRQTSVVADTLRILQKVLHEGVDSLRGQVDEAIFLIWTTRTDLRQIARELREFMAANRKSGREATALKLRARHNLPPRNDKFVGRETEIAEIHERLTRKSQLGVTQEAAAHGLGGIGKTSLAIEYGWRHFDNYPGGVFVVSCDCDTDALRVQVANLGPFIGVEEADTIDQTAEFVKARLESGPSALMILDNVRDADQWRDREWSRYIPGGNCRRLITTRRPHLAVDVEMFPVERFPREQGIDLIGRYRPDALNAENAGLVGDIVDWFDGLAVGLTVVGVYMLLHPDVTWAAYGSSLARKGLGTVRLSEADVERAVGALPEQYDRRIEVIFDETLAALSREQRRALEYAAILPVDFVGLEWISKALALDRTIDTPELPGYEGRAPENVVRQLIALNLLRPVRGFEGRVSLHRLLQRHLENVLDIDQIKKDVLTQRILVARTCHSCRRPVELGDQFCTHCAQQLVPFVRRCPACGSYPGRYDKFCIFCGTGLSPGDASVV